MLEDVVDALACPHCAGPLAVVPGRLCCPVGHSFDIARQGYASLLRGSSPGGDTADMIAARADVLNAGHFAPIAESVVEQSSPAGRALDVGAGTGYYLARVLDRYPDRTGIALDASKYATRRAAKAHPRIGAVVADTWRSLPVRTESVTTVLNVFAPRNPAEMHRVLRPDGRLVVVAPNSGHLAELVERLGLLSVHEHKRQRLEDRLGGLFEPAGERSCEFSLSLRHDEVEAVVAMGPSAWHAASERYGRIAELPEPVTVTASVTVSVHRRRS